MRAVETMKAVDQATTSSLVDLMKNTETGDFFLGASINKPIKTQCLTNLNLNPFSFFIHTSENLIDFRLLFIAKNTTRIKQQRRRTESHRGKRKGRLRLDIGHEQREREREGGGERRNSGERDGDRCYKMQILKLCKGFILLYVCFLLLQGFYSMVYQSIHEEKLVHQKVSGL